MKISRRNFLGKSLKTIALTAIIPVIAPFIPLKETQASNVPIPPKDKGEVVKCADYCADFKPHIQISDYVPGKPTPTWQNLTGDECSMCKSKNKCSQGGKKFISSMEHWNEKVMARLYKETLIG